MLPVSIKEWSMSASAENVQPIRKPGYNPFHGRADVRVDVLGEGGPGVLGFGHRGATAGPGTPSEGVSLPALTGGPTGSPQRPEVGDGWRCRS